MKRNICLSLLALASAAFSWAEPADLVLTSNHVIQMSSHRPVPAEPLAIAVTDGRITWIGEHADVAAHIGESTQRIDYGDRALLPGFIDAHGHIVGVGMYAALANVASPPVGPVNNIEDLQNALRAYIKDNDIAPGEWVMGRGYDDSLIAEKRHPDRDDLDAVSDAHPIALIHVSGHLMAANSRALARGGITAESADPPGGIIRRRAGSQEPDGVLEETAMTPLRGFANTVNKDPIAAVAEALDIYASYGLTTAQDGAASPELVQMLQAAAEAGALSMDVAAYPVGMGDAEQVIASNSFGAYENRLKIAGIKLFLDGSPQGKTAYLTKPYHVPPHGQDADYRGYPTIPQPTVDALVQAYLDAGVPILAHANGDAAADMLIDAVAAADPKHDHRTVMIHAQTLREDQITRMKTLNMVPSYFSAHTFYWGDWHRDSVLGPERGMRISPTASTKERGMIFTVHNDAPVVPPDTIRLLWATTNRRTRSDQVLGAEQRLSTYDALRAMTLYGAYQNFEEDSKGSLEVGKLADIAVLSENPLTVPAKDLLRIEVEATFSHGTQIYPRQ